MKILIVDDHAPARRFIRQMIAPLATEIFESSDGSESVSLCDRLRPDFVTMDLMMEGIDGLEATRRIRASCPAAKVIVVSVYGDRELKDAAEHAGACHFVAKRDLVELLRYMETAECPNATSAAHEAGPGLPSS